METITLAGGCFWCIEPVFRQLKGVHRVTSGYTAGHAPAPTYDAVCTGQTGHTEAVQIEFDEREISLGALLDVLFTIIDPTQLNRQGNDQGTQYRSGIYYASAEQEAEARAAILRHQPNFAQPIVTELRPAQEFYPAEEYHQRYYERHPENPYCQMVAAPKLLKARAKFAAYWRD